MVIIELITIPLLYGETKYGVWGGDGADHVTIDPPRSPLTARTDLSLSPHSPLALLQNPLYRRPHRGLASSVKDGVRRGLGGAVGHPTGWGEGGENTVLLSTSAATVHTLHTPPPNLFSLDGPSARRVPGHRVTQVLWRQYTHCTSQPSEPVPLADPSARTSLTFVEARL